MLQEVYDNQVEKKKEELEEMKCVREREVRSREKQMNAPKDTAKDAAKDAPKDAAKDAPKEEAVEMKPMAAAVPLSMQDLSDDDDLLPVSSTKHAIRSV